MKTTSLNSLFGKSLLAATIALAAQPLSAQETSDASEEGVEKILVTGSLIRKGSFDTTTPVKTVDASDIKGVGAVNLGDLLGRLPSIVGDTTSASSNISEQDSGLNTVALRNLGSSRTLVLVNGQRYVSGMSVGSGYGVDLNSIPTAMIQRIDVLTGGQSAAYGSDAVAGVVNIILKKNFDGAIFDVQTGVSGEGDKETVDIEFSIGRNFDSGNVWASLGYSDDEGLMATDRDFSRVHKNAVDTDGDGVLDTPQYVGSSHVRGGRIDKYNGDGSLFTRTSDVETSDAFNFHEYRSMLTPLKRMFAASGVSMDLSDASRFDVTMNYSRVDSRARFEPIPLDTRNDIFKLSRGGVTRIDIATHPWFVGTTLGENLLADGISSLDDASLTFRRLYEFGDRGAENTRSTFRVAANFEHDFDNYMFLRLSATHGVTDQAQTDYGDINLERARYALDVIDDGQGDYMCADQIARISGCVPFNPFALNGISDDAVDYLSADTGLKGEVQQSVLNATLSGEFDFSVTDDVMNIGFASGIEYREEKGQETPDPLRQAGIARGNQIAKTRGSFDVVDIFGELNIPIIEQLNINLAARYGDYSSVGETFNWTVNIDAPISDSFRLRGAVATAVRAPNVSDLFAGGAATSAIVTDPCNGIEAATTGNIAENCRSIDAIQRRIDNQGAFVLTQVESQNTSGLLSGSEDVGEEKADTLTAGFVFVPEQIDGLQLSVDYYNIEIDDAIAKTDRTVILNRCYSRSPSNFDPDCGGLVRRDGRTGAALDVNAASGNENQIETAGVDIDISYETALGSGDLYVAFSGNYLDKYNITGIETGDTQYLAGEILFPEIRYNLNVSYTIDKFNVYWQMRYWDETKDRNDNSLMTESLNTIDAQYYNDIRFSYQFNENANTYLGVKNVFDEQPPLLTADHKYQQAGTLSNGTAYDLVGRYFYAGITLSF